ncbi:MAG: marine proteobacterial sortase target protein [Pseudomonadota bacterium]
MQECGVSRSEGKDARRAGRHRRTRHGLNCLFACVLAWWAAISFANPPSDEAEGPQLRLHSLDGSVHSAALQLSAHLEIEVSGLLAKATLTQRFRNDNADWVEAEYLMPLPHDAAVTQLEIQLGQRKIRGQIRERAEARAVFEAARKAGKRSALLEQQRPHLFTTRVANIPPGEEIAVRVDLVLPIAFADGEFSLRFPTTVTAPFMPGVALAREAESQSSWLPLNGSGWALATDQVADAPLLSAPQTGASLADDSPKNAISMNVRLKTGIPMAKIRSRYHDLAVERVGDVFEIGLKNKVAEMDRDLVLNWRPQASALPQAAAFTERFEEEHYALLMVLPPQQQETGRSMSRELILVLDVSGSMQGEPIRQAKESVLYALATLSPRDRFNIIVFNDRHAFLFADSAQASEANLARARRFVRGMNAAGGTQMMPALRFALQQRNSAEETDSECVRQVIFVTDGAVGNEDALLTMLEHERGEARLFTVGIGSSPNSYFMQEVAEAGRGSSVFIVRPSEVAPELKKLFTRIDTPIATDLQVTWPGPVEPFPARVPDLYAGQPLLQVARFDGVEAAGSVRVLGRVGERAWERQLPLPTAEEGDLVARNWARSKLAAILTEGRRGTAPATTRSLALPLALRYQLASPYTSFVAVEDVAVRPEQAAVKASQVPNVVPRGQVPQAFAMAQGSTAGLLSLYLGCFLAFFGVIAYSMNRAEPC